jgi:hypothetical protein
MDNSPSSYFPRRGDGNGTFELVCPHCFLTVASGVKEPEIAELERSHLCWYRAQSLLIETATKHGEQDR